MRLSTADQQKYKDDEVGRVVTSILATQLKNSPVDKPPTPTPLPQINFNALIDGEGWYSKHEGKAEDNTKSLYWIGTETRMLFGYDKSDDSIDVVELKMARSLDIETTYVKTHRVKPGWKGKGKGLLQVLWERGFIDVSRLSEYRKRVEDADGKLVPELSLVHMLETCTDFANETSQLEYVGKELGVRVIITTKYHAEYAGEGIEYSWGYSKSFYRRHPLSAKKGKENFINLVDRCISRDLITVDMVRKFSKRARGYMLAYKILETDEMKEVTNEQQDITHHMIEKMKKVVSSHRAALDFDAAFIKKVAVAEGFDLVAEIKSEQKGLSKLAGVKRKVTDISP